MESVLDANTYSEIPRLPARKRPRDDRFLGVRRSALMETVFLLFVITLADQFFGDGTRFISASIHPYWLVLLLVIAQYGLAEALACAVLMSAFLLVGNMPEQKVSETIYEYALHVTRLPLLWFLTAAVAGEIRSRQIHEKELLKRELAQASRREETIASEYNRLKAARESLEERLAGESHSVLSIYQVGGLLQSLNEEAIKKGVRDIVASTLNPEQFSLYLYENKALRCVLNHGWANDKYKRSFAHDSLLCRTVAGQKRALCILREEDEAVLGKEGVMAVAVSDPRTGKGLGMLKIEKIDMARVTPLTMEAFKSLCEWTGMAIANAKIFQALCSTITSGGRERREAGAYAAGRTDIPSYGYGHHVLEAGHAAPAA